MWMYTVELSAGDVADPGLAVDSPRPGLKQVLQWYQSKSGTLSGCRFELTNVDEGR